MATVRLPALIDRPTLQRELGVTEHAAERIMRQVPLVRPPALRKVFVRRQDVTSYLDSALLEPTPDGIERTGVSAWIRTRTTEAGERRYMVMYRRGGRGTKAQNANTFRTMREARMRRDLVAGWLALGLDPKVELAKLLNPEQTRTLAGWFDAFIDSRVDVTVKTLAGYRNAKDRWLDALGDLSLADLAPGRIQDAIVTGLADLSPGTLSGYRSVLRQVLDYAEMEPNPARSRKVRLPRETKAEVVPPSSREWVLIRSHLSDDRLVCVRLIECCGLRLTEALELTYGDVDREHGRLRISKARTKGRTSGQRWLPVPAELFAELGDGDRDRLVFTGLSEHAVRSALRRACDKAGVDRHSPHPFRHRRISLWVAHGFDPVTVKTWSGHTKTQMTLDTYSHVMTEPHLDEWREFWVESYRAERLERRGFDYAAVGPEGEPNG